MLQLAIPPIGPVHGARADASDDSSGGAESRIVPKLLPREEVRQPKWATELLREYRTRAK